jgi:hypothetical protein
VTPSAKGAFNTSLARSARKWNAKNRRAESPPHAFMDRAFSPFSFAIHIPSAARWAGMASRLWRLNQNYPKPDDWAGYPC